MTVVGYLLDLRHVPPIMWLPIVALLVLCALVTSILRDLRRVDDPGARHRRHTAEPWRVRRLDEVGR